MMAGRDALHGHAMWRWADEGEEWLRKQFAGKPLEFGTMVDVEKREVTLSVFHRPNAEGVLPENVGPAGLIFTVTEPVQSFVSQLTVTKLILIAG